MENKNKIGLWEHFIEAILWITWGHLMISIIADLLQGNVHGYERYDSSLTAYILCSLVLAQTKRSFWIIFGVSFVVQIWGLVA